MDLRRLESIVGRNCSIISDGTGSVIGLSSLSSMATPLRASELTARNGGVILLGADAFLLQNVAVNIPPGNPMLPSTVSVGPSLSLYGQPWHSYWVEVRDTRNPAGDWGLFRRVPLTSAMQVLTGPPKPWQAFRVWEFVADPAIVDLNRATGGQVQLVLYGAPPKSFEVQTTDSLDTQPADWAPTGLATGPMTNAFRIFPAFAPLPEPNRFFRSKEV